MRKPEASSRTELAQQWSKNPLPEELSTCYPIDREGRKSITGEILIAASGPSISNKFLQGLHRLAAIELAANALGVPRLHINLIEQVLSDHIGNRKRRTETTADVAITVLTAPEKYLGENTAQIMTFGRLFDLYTPDQLRFIKDHPPKHSWNFQEESKRANTGWRRPDYIFGRDCGWHMAKQALILNGIVGMWTEDLGPQPFVPGSGGPSRYIDHPTNVELGEIVELAGTAVNEIQNFGHTSAETEDLYFLPKFFDPTGQPLTLKWLQQHPAADYSPKVRPESVAAL